MLSPIVVNLFAGPGSGKSTTAAGLFFILKCAGHKAELVVEYPKELTYERKFEKLKDQMGVLKEQARRQAILFGQVDIMVTDGPLPLMPVYSPDELKEQVTEASNALFNQYRNVNVWIKRVKPYQSYGRSQSEAEARVLDGEILWHLNDQNIPIHFEVDGDTFAPAKIFEFLMRPNSNVDTQHHAAEAARS